MIIMVSPNRRPQGPSQDPPRFMQLKVANVLKRDRKRMFDASMEEVDIPNGALKDSRHALEASEENLTNLLVLREMTFKASMERIVRTTIKGLEACLLNHYVAVVWNRVARKLKNENCIA